MGRSANSRVIKIVNKKMKKFIIAAVLSFVLVTPVFAQVSESSPASESVHATDSVKQAGVIGEGFTGSTAVKKHYGSSGSRSVEYSQKLRIIALLNQYIELLMSK